MLASVKSFAISFAVALLIFGVTAYFTYPYINNNLLNGFAYSDEETGTQSEEDTAGSSDSTIQPTVNENPFNVTGESFTALFVISDYEPDVYRDYRCDLDQNASISSYISHSRHYKADTIVLMRADKERGEYFFTAFPNNSVITYGTRQFTLGSIYEDLGLDALEESVSAAMGLPINYCTELQFNSLKSVIDLLGGVQFNVPQDMEASYDIPSQYLGKNEFGQDEYSDATQYVISLKKGKQLLDGEKAVQLLRFEDYSGGQAERAKVAAQFMREFAEQYFNQDNFSKLKLGVELIISLSEWGSTEFTSATLDLNRELICTYSEFTKKMPEISGESWVENNVSYFEFSRLSLHRLFEPYRD